jgi:hypothetical protein
MKATETELPPRHVLNALTVIGLIVATVLATVAFLAVRQQVVTQLHAISPTASLVPRSIHPSKTHGIYVSFDIRGDSELSYAYWRLLPSPHVDFTK